MGYPGIILDENADEVEGFIFSSKELYKKYEELDAFEGEEYKRVKVDVLCAGEKIEAEIYALNN